jgi:hypothetical protein
LAVPGHAASTPRPSNKAGSALPPGAGAVCVIGKLNQGVVGFWRVSIYACVDIIEAEAKGLDGAGVESLLSEALELVMEDIQAHHQAQ